jgi:antitoxin component of RelBE/YafQ-DinJ toxin-antitoxin module
MTIPIAVHEARLSARVPYEVREAAERAAEARGLSLSEWLRLTIQRAAQETPSRTPARRRRPGT